MSLSDVCFPPFADPVPEVQHNFKTDCIIWLSEKAENGVPAWGYVVQAGQRV